MEIQFNIDHAKYRKNGLYVRMRTVLFRINTKYKYTGNNNEINK